MAPTARPLHIAIPTIDDSILRAVAFAGDERLSELFNFEVHLVAALETVVPFDKIVGQPATVSLQHLGVTRYFNGVVAELTEGERDQRSVHYHARLVPTLWLYQLQVQSRLFHWTSVPDILATVLADLKPHLKLRLSEEHPLREYCVQYQEADFAFACRLMEEEGIYYFFEHHAGHHDLVLTDSRISIPPVPGQHRIPFNHDLEHAQAPGIGHWRKTQRAVCPQFSVRDYNFQAADKHFDETHKINEKAKAGKVEHTLNAGVSKFATHVYPGGFAKNFGVIGLNGEDKASAFSPVFQEGKRVSKLLSQAGAVPALEVGGTSNCPQFAPGFKFTLEHFDAAHGDYLLLGVQHQTSELSFSSGADAKGFSYENRITGIPAEVQFRPPRRTPRPIIPGVQTAQVVTHGGETSIDKFGRVKVKFHWDRGSNADLTSSCWLRVGQLWAGKKWGSAFFPRLGQEVIVAFVDGDPDCPIIVDCAYNSVNMPPFTLPDYVGIGGIKSCVLGGDPEKNFNGIFFHDAQGEEYTHIHSETSDVQNAEENSYKCVPHREISYTGSL